MKGRSGIGVWLLLFGCAAMIVGAMGWLTKNVIEAERERSLADARADLQERIRLSLWRMDSSAAAVMIEENQRTPENREILPENPVVRMRFQVTPAGEVITSCDDMEQVDQLQTLISGAGRITNPFMMMCVAAHQGAEQWGANDFVAANTPMQYEPRKGPTYQVEANRKERAVRGTAINNAVGKSGLIQQAVSPQAPPLTAAGMFQPAWIGDQPFLLRSRKTEAGGITAMEGAWLDLDGFRAILIDEIGDLLPAATLEAIEPGVADTLALASFPWKLIPGETAVASSELRSPVVTSLIAGWVAVAAALLAGAALVRGVMKLSERRASFVSAVTHELRTPLTTFRLYSEMLESGAVRDEKKRGGYFKTLRREADRLSHLVENVLAFSRIERGSARSAVKVHQFGELLETMRERFEERLAGADMTLETEVAENLSIRGDAAGIEHVLFNLIDNAAKYAASGDSKRVTLSAEAAGHRVEIRVSDDGPGIPDADRKRIFRAFHKSAQAAAESRPGVGLGLSLSRRLARDMGGELEYRNGSAGACFVLSLPTA